MIRLMSTTASQSCSFPATKAFVIASLVLAGMGYSKASSAEDAFWQTYVGFDFSSGKYGESSTTEMLYLPLIVKYQTFPLSFKATVPYLHISGPVSAVGGFDGIEITDTTSSSDNEIRNVSGLGDVQLSASWAMDTLWNHAPYADLVAKVKLPTADEDKGLGTGELDTQLQLDLASVHGAYTPLFTIGHKWPGYDGFKNQTLASLGFDFRISEKNNLGTLFDYRDASSDSQEPRREWTFYYQYKLSRQYRLMSYVVTGSTSASPDWSFGAQISYRR